MKSKGECDDVPFSEEIQSIFCSPALDDLLAYETKKLETKTDALLEKLNSNSRSVTYSTPVCQSSYVKTLQTVLKERGRENQKSQNSGRLKLLALI